MQVRIMSAAALALAALVASAQVGSVSSLAQEKPAEAKVAKKPEGRVPAFYGQVGISDEQRKKIYSIQGGYDEKIDALKKQIDDLEEKRDAEVKAVLSVDQQKRLVELQEASKKKAAETRSKKKAEAAEKGSSTSSK